MNQADYVDIFSTKGMEYVFILGFIVALVFFWKFLNRAGTLARPGAVSRNPIQGDFKQCILAPNLYYHQGHSWVEQEGPDVARIGIDDFAQKLIGRVDIIELPGVAASLKQGEKGWSLIGDSETIDVLSPVDGEVLAINQKALEDPQVVNRDPYGTGWLLKIRVPKMNSNINHLLSGKLAEVWMKENMEALSLKISENGASSPDVDLMTGDDSAEEQPRHGRKELAREFLLCK